MTLEAIAASAIAAVKNGPAGMWRGLGSSGSAGPIGRFTTSPLWLLATTCGYVALAAVISRRTRGAHAPFGKALAITTAILGPLVVVQLLARSGALGLFLLVVIVSTWAAVLLKTALPPRRQTRGSAEVVDLARWRGARGAHRHHGSR